LQQKIRRVLIMNMTTNYSSITAQPEYDIDFWNAMRNKPITDKVLSKGRNTTTGTYAMPSNSSGKLMKALEKESIFRGLATVLRAYKTGYRIFAKDSKDMAQFVPEGGEIPIYDAMEDFTNIAVDSFKITSLVRLDEDFINDAGFDIEKYLIERYAKSFARAEDNAFINGNGEYEPTGILHDTDGADIALTTEALTYDDVISLYFSVESEYRRNGVWLMNDKTALALRKLKDADGNYLWNSSNDTILGKPVIISEFMPDAASGTKPIAFGDFSYYWVIGRKPISVRTLIEKFTFYDQIGYLAIEYLDGKLVRKEAIKVIQMKKSDE
jgi:HK97 family phage major capsid protein